MHLADETYWRLDEASETISITTSKPVYEQMDVDKAREVRDTLSELIAELEAREND
ncbi:hypothetical protein NDI76_11470 [Halogeometricum sp. S1BR25-6]|uniref:DUF1508 domain-containing protein n=1 Tax=Halogeometricum salsisoli TaxID=2950536 RepID=A0ABU2GFX3_9EURY|nr:hypothetical protein [Halogeometricum sp. S1BR25-6]MDS0299361.1 hypothetical protein [Halogeometricum sp. S1BR25-6]